MDLDWIDLVIVLAAAARLWHLGGTDKISDPLRRHTHASIRQWLTCPRCSGLWSALAVACAWISLRYGYTHEHLAAALLLGAAMNWTFWSARDLINDALDALASRRFEDAEADQAAAEYAASPAARTRLRGPVIGGE